jgi:glycosyltransferase involved in cell wall biosynthesis
VRVLPVAYGPNGTRTLRYIRQSILREALRTLQAFGAKAPWIEEGSLHSAFFDMTALAKSVPARLYIAHNLSALPAAARAAKSNHALYAFDAEDYHHGVEVDRSDNEFEKRTIRRIEQRYLSGAAYVTSASPLIAEAYAETYGLPLPAVILNVFPRANAPPAPTPQGVASPGPSLYWFSQTVGAGRGLETAIAAIARAVSRPHLYLRGSPATGYEAKLRALAAREGVAERLHFLPPAAPDQMERIGAEYDVGYVGEIAATRNRQIALTNKLFSYLTSGLPIVASDIQSHVQLAPALGAAMTLFAQDDSASLAAAIDNYLLNPARLAASREHAWRLGQGRYCWEVERATLLSIVARLITLARP